MLILRGMGIWENILKEIEKLVATVFTQEEINQFIEVQRRNHEDTSLQHNSYWLFWMLDAYKANRLGNGYKKSSLPINATTCNFEDSSFCERNVPFPDLYVKAVDNEGADETVPQKGSTIKLTREEKGSESPNIDHLVHLRSHGYLDFLKETLTPVDVKKVMEEVLILNRAFAIAVLPSKENDENN